MDQRLYCSRRQLLSDRPELSQLKKPGPADGSDMIRRSRMTPLTHQAVQVGTGQAALMPRVLEGNRRFGHASQNSVVNTHRGSRPIREMSTLHLLSVGHGALYL